MDSLPPPCTQISQQCEFKFWKYYRFANRIN